MLDLAGLGVGLGVSVACSDPIGSPRRLVLLMGVRIRLGGLVLLEEGLICLGFTMRVDRVDSNLFRA